MKNILLYISTIFISTILYGQAPEKINYQAVVRDVSGNVITNTSISVSIDINSCSVYSGNLLTNGYGLINIELDLSSCSINWSTGSVILNSNINGVTGSSNLQSVPYSIYSNISDSTANYPKTGGTDGYILVWDGTNNKWVAQAGGANGNDGAPGADGADGYTTLVEITTEAAGTNCASGGQKVLTGLDVNNNLVIDVPSEVIQTKYVCDGNDGTNGNDGAPGTNGTNGNDGTDGAPGADGADGLACWDLNGDGVQDAT